jgi:hypothetical protein
MKLRTRFRHKISDSHEIEVVAKARSVTSYGAKNLKIKLYTPDGEEYDQVLDEESNLELEEAAVHELYMKKFELKEAL